MTTREFGTGIFDLQSAVEGGGRLQGKEDEIREQTSEFFSHIAQEMANVRYEALTRGIKVPLGFVISGDVAIFPAESEDEGQGWMVMAVGFVSRSGDSDIQINAIADMIRQQVNSD